MVLASVLGFLHPPGSRPLGFGGLPAREGGWLQGVLAWGGGALAPTPSWLAVPGLRVGAGALLCPVTWALS